jgi:hypothetical protein
MNKQWYAAVAVSLLLAACGGSDKNNGTNKAVTKAQDSAMQKQRFFRVTDFLLGEVTAIKQKGVNPMKVTQTGQQSDTAWLTLDQLGTELKDFLQPVIDSTNLITLFKENRFEDLTLQSITFTYEPWGSLPDSMALRRWDVYIDPDMGTVKKLYLVKRVMANGQARTMQLTWETGKRCKMITFNPAGTAVEKTVTVHWDF